MPHWDLKLNKNNEDAPKMKTTQRDEDDLKIEDHPKNKDNFITDGDQNTKMTLQMKSSLKMKMTLNMKMTQEMKITQEIKLTLEMKMTAKMKTTLKTKTTTKNKDDPRHEDILKNNDEYAKFFFNFYYWILIWS